MCKEMKIYQLHLFLGSRPILLGLSVNSDSHRVTGCMGRRASLIISGIVKFILIPPGIEHRIFSNNIVFLNLFFLILRACRWSDVGGNIWLLN